MTTVEESPAVPRGREEAAPPPLGKNRNFLLLWTGAGISILGSRISAIAYTLLVYWSTGSAVSASLVTFAALLPHLFMQLPAGAIADRWNRRNLMIACDLGRMLAISTVVVMVIAGELWLPLLMAVAFVEGSLTIFYLIAERASVFTVVPDVQIGAAMSRNEARSQAAGLIGQPIGTLLFAVLRWLPFGATAVAHLISLVTLLFIRANLQGDRSGPRRHIAAEIAEGFRFVWSQLYLRRALGLIAASNILFQVLALALIVIIKTNGGSPATIGYIIGASAVAGMLGALCSNFFMRRWGIRRIIMTVNGSWAVLMSLIAFAQQPGALAAIFSVILFGAGVSNVAGIVFTMKTTPENMQGRVGSIATLLASGGNSLGALVAGVLLDSVSIESAMLLVGGVMTVLAVLAVLGFGGRKAAELERGLNLTY
jgi:MFS family permease